jgi:A/G-specific adenine glycosylase
MPRYTQGLMDLGAGICLPRNPSCMLCPLQGACVARRDGNPQDYPVRTRRLKRSAQAWWLLLRQDGAGRLWLERRPSAGIWAGLYCPPVYGSRAELDAALPLPAAGAAEDLPPFIHVLTHRDLHLHPVLARGTGAAADPHCAEGLQAGWFTPAQCQGLGLPAPVRRLIDTL